jgi:hypothetical protein
MYACILYVCLYVCMCVSYICVRVCMYARIYMYIYKVSREVLCIKFIYKVSLV